MAASQAHFSLYRDRAGEWRFRFRCSTGVDRLRSSEGYTAKASAIKAIKSVKRNLLDNRRFEFKESAKGSSFFVLKSRNGNTLAMSRTLADREDLDVDYGVVTAEASSARIVDGEGVN